MTNTKYAIKSSQHEAKHWPAKIWDFLGDETNNRRIDVLVKIGGGVVVSVVIFFVGQYVQRQSYYSSLLDKYLTSTEQLLIKDTLELRRQKKDNPDETPTPKQLQSNIESLIRTNTEITLRSLSENDGFPLTKWFNNNAERRQLLINFLRNSQLGFKDQEGHDPDKPFDSLLEKLNLGSLTDTSLLDLEGIDLSFAILHDADLTGTNLKGAAFTQSDLKGIRLYEADLSGANLSGANLSGANLTKTTLQGTNLTQANLIGAIGAKEADLTKAKLCKTTFPDGTKRTREGDCPKK
jgi:uncharacterized protein YjbI with pentapeptide repeats